MKITKYAAIDIGSNAIRLLLVNVLKENEEALPQFNKNALIRMPIRLGQDSFTKGKISKKNKERLRKAFKAFKAIMEIHGVKDYRACATSALREASNAKEIVKKIKRETGLKIEVIDGQLEAEIISNTNIFRTVGKEKPFLYVDVGGGSTEFTLIVKEKRVASKSFKIGTVRMINQGVDKAKWNEVEGWIKTHTKEYNTLSLVGTGGNINKLFKLSKIKEGESMSSETLNSIYSKLKTMTYEERILHFNLNPDRSDVIIPASEIYLKTLEWSGIRDVFVPKIGLSDGMIKLLHKKNEQK